MKFIESMLDVNENHKTEQSILCPTNPYFKKRYC